MESYKDDLKGNPKIISRKIRTIKDIDRSADQLQWAIYLVLLSKLSSKDHLLTKNGSLVEQEAEWA
jgi:hypothetical protein